MQQPMYQHPQRQQQIVGTIMETQMQAVPRTTMVPQTQMTMAQTMETQTTMQPRTFMTTQTQQVMRPSYEMYEQMVPRTEFHPEHHTVRRRRPHYTWTDHEEEMVQMVPEQTWDVVHQQVQTMVP